MNERKEDMVSHPSHYRKGDPVYEPYRVIGAWNCNFNIGSAIKYLARYKDKWDPVEDLMKAKQYIDFEIEALTGEKPELCTEDGHSDPGRKIVEKHDMLLIREPAGQDVPVAREPAGQELELRRRVMRSALGMSEAAIDDALKM